jgi:hypothetical protein
MGINNYPKSIYEVSFGYPYDLNGYTTLMPDIMKLSDYVWQKEFLNNL